MPTRVRPTTRLSCEALEARDVPATLYPTTAADLVAAIESANSSPVADTIVLAAGATYTLTAVNNSTHGATGLPVVEAEGGELTIVGRGAIIERSAAAGTPQSPTNFRLIAVEAGASLTAENLTLQGGVAREYLTAGGSLQSARGGAVFNQGALTLRRVTVQGNTAWGFTPFRQPTGTAFGGGVYSDGALTITGGTIRNNLARGGDGADGGPGHFDSPSGLPGGSGAGGGVFVRGGTASLSRVALTANTAQGGDGGSAVRGKGARGGAKGGAGGAGRGGGLYAAGGSTELTDCTVRQNAAVGGSKGRAGASGSAGSAGPGEGGGIYVGPVAAVDWDAATVIKNNAATSKGKNVHRA